MTQKIMKVVTMQMPSGWVLGAGLCNNVNFSLFLIAWYNINICGNRRLPLTY